MARARIQGVRVARLRAPLREPFVISRGAQTAMENILVAVLLEDGALGHGECAPYTPKGESTAGVLAKLKARAGRLSGLSGAGETLARKAGGLFPDSPSARAAVEMAVLDAWGRRQSAPLRRLFGKTGARVATDLTISISPPAAAARAGARIARLGIRAVKIKVGTEPEEDAARVAAAVAAARPRILIVDGNEGFTPASALRLLRLLRQRGLRPDLFEQPVRRDDLEGLREVASAGVAVAADEAVATPQDVRRLAKKRAAQVVNVKLMKCGLLGALEVAREARKAGLGLMIGGMVESRLAMACAAHLASGLGGFRFVDLDTPYYLAEDPVAGPARIGRGGVWDLSRVRGGIGVWPKRR